MRQDIIYPLDYDRWNTGTGSCSGNDVFVEDDNLHWLDQAYVAAWDALRKPEIHFNAKGFWELMQRILQSNV